MSPCTINVDGPHHNNRQTRRGPQQEVQRQKRSSASKATVTDRRERDILIDHTAAWPAEQP